jgi:uncharacterized protein (TIGR03083 family)
MNTVDSTDISTIPSIEHGEAMDLQAAEFERALGLLRSLDPADWSVQTDCPDWDVRQMWLHVLGASEAGASIRENIRQMRLARKRCKQSGEPLEAGLSAVQVAERLDLTPGQLVERLEHIAPKTVTGRGRVPGPVRAIKIGIDGPVVEKWSLGYLTDIIFLRDAWMHRVDTARATGREFGPTAAHDGRIVADVVAEWARRHGRPFVLELTGAAGGSYQMGSDGESIEIDAIEFCRLLAGRGEPTGLLATIVPF